MLFTAIAFVALMVFQWGMDITGRSSGSFGEIGRVNGDPVMYEAYMASYRRIYDEVQNSQEGLITSQQNTDIEDAAFDEVVTQILVSQELRRRGITVTNQEISEAAQFAPPDYLRPVYLDENGVFDLARYQAELALWTPEQLLLLEAYYRDVIPRGKLLRQVTSGIYVSDGDLWQSWRDQNEQVEVRYVPLDPATRYDDDQFEISEEDVLAYYRDNEEDFEVPARATVMAVVLDKTPTAADTAASLERAVELREEILGGADFGEVAQRESVDQATAVIGGDLGVFPQGLMSPPFDTVVFSATVGELSEPVETPFGFHLVEVTERWAADSAHARHVLVPIIRTDDSEFGLLTVADSIEDLGEAMSLAEAGAALGLTATTVEITETFAFLAGAGQVSEGADWAFEEASPGDVSPVFETEQAFYALELVNSEPAGLLPMEEARPSIESALRFERKMEQAGLEGQVVVNRVRAGEPLVNAAAEAGLEVRTAGPFARWDFVPGLGRQNAAIGTAFGLDVGEVSEVVTTSANAFIIEVISHSPPDSVAWLEQALAQRAQTVTALEQQRLQIWIEALRSSARIVDRRAEVLQPADADIPQMPMVF
jgi:peptidyl-prolyl cis-trans isomerase D